MTIVTWARHGENLANVTRTFSFLVCDESLTGRGCRQARDLAAQLAAGPAPDRIVCSPLRRAAETAAILAEALGTADVTADENLREVNIGSLDGRNDARSWDTYNSVLDAWRHGDYCRPVPGRRGLRRPCRPAPRRIHSDDRARRRPGPRRSARGQHPSCLPLLAAVTPAAAGHPERPVLARGPATCSNSVRTGSAPIIKGSQQ